MPKPAFRRRIPPKLPPKPSPPPTGDIDFEAEVIAELVRAAPWYEQLQQTIAPMIEDLSLGIAAHAGDALLANDDALKSAISILLGGRPAPSNQPPEPMKPDVLRELLVEKHAPLTKRQQDLLAAADRFHKSHEKIEDADTQGKAAEFVRQIQAAVKAEEAAHKEEKSPWNDGGKVVQGFFAGLWDPLSVEKRKIEAKMLAFATALANQQRKEAAAAAAKKQADADAAALRAAETMDHESLEEAAIAADEAAIAAAHAASRPADHSRVRGDLGAVSSLVTRWRVMVIDKAKLPTQFLMADEAALKLALHDAPRGLDGTPRWNVPGTELQADQSMGVR